MNLGAFLVEGAKEFGVDVSDNQLDQFFKYLENLKKWNNRINLTAITTDREIVLNHFIDSISIVPLINSQSNMLDIGSGGGFPGIPVKIVCPDLNATLLDSVNKKVLFMNDTIRNLKLKNIKAVWGRAEDPENNIPRNSFHYVVTRAVGAIADIVKLSRPYLNDHGLMVLMRGKRGTSEWTESKKELDSQFKLIDIKEFSLPYSDQLRTIIVLKPL